ncbi:MAG: S-adenosylmethionine:tRNA ribosyltransferase-isomerase [Schleiferiaceae bacterium]|nr:S-adenosylmethionine:tRNA ribosyltransferase-isomerase [Schleiferiaceae bacterium]
MIAIKNLSTADYTYLLPDGQIAKNPLAQRDASKCLIYDNGTISECIYRNVHEKLEPNAILFRNTTKVIQARMLFPRPNAKPFEVFCLEPADLDIQQAMVAKQTILYKALIGGAKKWKQNPQVIHFEDNYILEAHLEKRMGSHFLVRFNWNSEHTFAELLELLGKTPIPPYLNRQAEESDKNRYQTVFAEHAGSVAAPTAGLHFTPELLTKIQEKDIQIVDMILHVGAGTFKPVSADTIGEHEMHAEPFEVSKNMLQVLQKQIGNPIYVIGTTSLRCLESVYWMGNKLINQEADFHYINQWTPYESAIQATPNRAIEALLNYMESNNQTSLTGNTQLLIGPGYTFRYANYLFTNFHQPNSTLLLLVAAAIGEDWKRVYAYALENNYRFLSYGDGSLLKINPKNCI